MKKLLAWPILWWLRFWARLVLQRVDPFIIGITGSAGKTSLRDVVGSVARLRFKRVKIAHKANSESGIPADILGLHFTNFSGFDWLRVCLLAPVRAVFPERFDCYVVEMGVDEPVPPKNMGYLLTIFKPDLGVVLNALPVHTQQFEERLGISDPKQLVAKIATEKGRMVTENDKLETAVLFADQTEVAELQPGNDAATITFGRGQQANVRVKDMTVSLQGTKITLQYKKQPHEIRLNNFVLPEFYGQTLAAAFAVGLALGVTPDEIVKTLGDSFTLPPGRGQIYSGIYDTIIIDSSYNASRETTIGSLNLLRRIAGRRDKLAVLGDMRELGSQAQAEHEAVAQAAVGVVDKAVLVGPLMRKYVLPILQKNKVEVDWFPTAGQAGRFLKKTLKGKEVILVKGSQNTIFLEIVVEALLLDKKNIANLCRRGSFWDKRRKVFE